MVSPADSTLADVRAVISGFALHVVARSIVTIAIERVWLVVFDVVRTEPLPNRMMIRMGLWGDVGRQVSWHLRYSISEL